MYICKEFYLKAKSKNKYGSNNMSEPDDHLSCIAHLSAEDMLKSVVTEKRSLKILNLDQGQ